MCLESIGSNRLCTLFYFIILLISIDSNDILKILVQQNWIQRLS